MPDRSKKMLIVTCGHTKPSEIHKLLRSLVESEVITEKGVGVASLEVAAHHVHGGIWSCGGHARLTSLRVHVVQNTEEDGQGLSHANEARSA